MSDVPDDIPKEFLDLIQRLLRGNTPSNDLGGIPSIVGVKFVVGGSGAPDRAPHNNRRKTVLEVMDEGDHYTIQTELPGECPNDFAIEYTNGKLRLLTGVQKNHVAEVPLDNIDPDLTRTHLKNSVLEITCFKRKAES